uniref:Magnesium transporter NIPA2 n=2 Tax=Hirondellea gigas TaxID=1518452 RepID=A0A6A7FYJ6_9CRUS
MSGIGSISHQNYSEDEFPEEHTPRDLWIGLILAMLSSLFIGSSFIVKKKSLQQLSRSGKRRAAAGGYGYLKNWLWWIGFLTMGAGEVFNFVAYTFAPAALVTPLGALSVLVTSVLAAHLLHEALNMLAKLGCALCLLGSTVVVIHAPQQSHVNTLAQLSSRLLDPAFVWYVVALVAVVVLLLVYCSPRYGSRNVLVYLTVCSLIGGLSVLCCKALGLALQEVAQDKKMLLSPLLWISLILLVLFVSVQMIYLNKSLDIFATNVVTPIYYVLFTSSVLLASAILFKEWDGLEPKDALGILAGFFTTIVGVTLLHAFRDIDISRLKLGTLLSSNNSNNNLQQHQHLQQQTECSVGSSNGAVGGGASPCDTRSSRASSAADNMWGAANGGDDDPMASSDEQPILPTAALHSYGVAHQH